MAYTNEQPLRTTLRLSLDPSTGARRPGHRVDWIAHALAPARDKIDPETFGKVSRALTVLLGIDPVVVMKDIAGASQEAIDALEWSARALVGAALAGGTPASRARKRPLVERRVATALLPDRRRQRKVRSAPELSGGPSEASS